ncbi:kinase-like protein [Mycena galericulata]|nr:kinase-like protein [Mycena galericulata]
MPADTGYGFPVLEFEENLGPENRYKIVRKLGWGMNSSIWLVWEQQSKSYLALKILTGNCTQWVEKGMCWEREALLRVSSPPHENCLHLQDSFPSSGKGSSGSHLCLVTQLLANDVKSTWNNVPLPLPLAKRVLLHTLRGLAHAHKCGVVHTDLKPDNIFIANDLTVCDIDALLQADPSRRHEEEASYDGIVRSAVTQPIPGPTMEEGLSRTYVLGDFGSAQPIGKRLTDSITPESLRPPEIWLGNPWNEKVDIWTFGCLVFEFVTGRRLFVPEPRTIQNVALDSTESLLHQIICITGEDFTEGMLQHSPHASQWFDSTCNLRKQPPLFDYPYARVLKDCRVGSAAEIKTMAALLQRCVRLDPADRASAEDLLSDPWFQVD